MLAHVLYGALLQAYARLLVLLPLSSSSSTTTATAIAAHALHDANVWCILAIAAAVLTVLYVFCAVLLPGWRMDYYLSKLPTVRGAVPVLGHALLLAGPAPWTRMAQWSYYPNMHTSAAAAALTSAHDGKADKNDDMHSSPSSQQQPHNHVSRLVTFNVGGTRVVYINEPRLLKRVLLTQQRNYRKAIDAAYKHFMCLLGTGLVTSEGEHWKKGRLLLSRALRVDILEDVPEMTMHAVNRISAKLTDAATALVHQRLGRHRHDDDGNTANGDAAAAAAAAAASSPPYVDLNEEFRHMTLQVISESALSLTPAESDAIFPSLYLPIVHECNRRVWAPWRVFMPWLQGCRERRRCLRALNAVLSDIIQKRWARRHEAATAAATAKPDILALCMSQIDHMDKRVVLELRDDVKTMLLAGHETSAALLTWATYETLRRPAVRARIVAEARVLFDPSRCARTMQTAHGLRGVPTADDVRSLLVWTPAVLRETLRVHSVVPVVMRYTDKKDVWPASETGLAHDVTIPAGCIIAVGIEGVHKNPDVWSQPEVFDPERFIDAEIANNTNTMTSTSSKADGSGSGSAKTTATAQTATYTKRIDPYAFIPFINGPRNCLGQHLSLIETQVALSYLFLTWDLQLYRGAQASESDAVAFEKAVGRHHDYIIPQVPHDGLKVCGTPL